MYKYIRIYTYDYMYISISSYTYTYRYIHIHINIYIHTSSTATTTMTHPHIHRGGGGTRNQRKSAASETSRAPPQPHNHRGGGGPWPIHRGGGGGGRRCTIYVYSIYNLHRQFFFHLLHDFTAVCHYDRSTCQPTWRVWAPISLTLRPTPPPVAFPVTINCFAWRVETNESVSSPNHQWTHERVSENKDHTKKTPWKWWIWAGNSHAFSPWSSQRNRGWLGCK